MAHVLVLDTDESTFGRVEESIESGRLGLVTAHTVPEALQATAGKDVALILCNAGLANMDGYAAVNTLIEHHPAATALLMTSGFEVFDSQRAIEVGIKGCVAKPFSPQGLRARIEAELGSLDIEMQTQFTPTITSERLATILPDHPPQDPVVVDPSVVAPALERAILGVLPEVVEAVMRQSIVSSAPFQRTLEGTVRRVLDERLEGIVSEVVRERVQRIETDGES